TMLQREKGFYRAGRQKGQRREHRLSGLSTVSKRKYQPADEYQRRQSEKTRSYHSLEILVVKVIVPISPCFCVRSTNEDVSLPVFFIQQVLRIARADTGDPGAV